MRPSTVSQPVPLLRLDSRDVRGLEWIKTRARAWLTACKRRRKYRPKGSFDAEELVLLRALVDLERAAGRLLALVNIGNQEVPPAFQETPGMGACARTGD